MILPSRFLAYLTVLFLAVAPCVYAQDAPPMTASADGTLHVLRPIIHAEQDRAELCLEFDHPLDDSDHARAAMSVHLESSGKTIAVPQQGLNITAATLCLPSLDHRRSYHLTLANLRGSNSEKLTEPYLFSFTVPDRQASLAFLSDLFSGGIMRWQNNDPVLRGINVGHVKIELYRITTLPLMTEAWRQHKQTTLAPTESAYFARDKGQLVWQGDMTLDDNPNNVVEQKVALHDAVPALTPGFYLVVASAILPKTEASKNVFVPLAAAWLLRSDLKVHALRDADGYYAVTEKADASDLYKNIHVLLEDANQQTVADGKSGDDGTAHLSLSKDKRGSAATLIGVADNGDVDFVDVTQGVKTRLLLPDIDASLESDKPFYVPGTTANIILTSKDSIGQPLTLDNTHLQILRPDRSLFTSVFVPKTKSGATHLSLPVPAAEGRWFLQWQQSDNHILAETTLRITTHDDAPHLKMSADRPLLNSSGPDSGDLTLNLTSTTASGKVAPFIAGQIMVAWVKPDMLFPGWEAYHFGSGDVANTNPVPVAHFLTDAKGEVQLHIHIMPPHKGGIFASGCDHTSKRRHIRYGSTFTAYYTC